MLARFGRIDVLVNNAGLSEMAAIEELEDDALQAMLDVNVIGTVRMLRTVAPVMRAQGSGDIVNVSSLVGRMSMPVNGGYAATKFAVEALSDAARQELAPFGVRVIVVQPGSIATRFADAMLDRSRETLEDPTSPYRELYARNDALTVKLRKDDAPVEAVSAVVLEALRSRRPRGTLHRRDPAAGPPPDAPERRPARPSLGAGAGEREGVALPLTPTRYTD